MPVTRPPYNSGPERYLFAQPRGRGTAWPPMNRTDSPLLLHGRFIEQARLTPDRTALLEGDRAVSFSELEARSSRAAASLRQGGLQPGAIVALHLERSIDWVVGALAILGAGGIVVPLPPSYPRERQREILEFASFDAVIESERWPMPRDFGIRVLDLADLERPQDVGLPDTPPSPDQAAFILCSSGSTGRPKMIARSHRSFFHRLEWTWTNHPFGVDDVGCQKAPTTTTHSVYELFEPLLAGAPVLLLSDEDGRNLERFWELLAERGVTRLLIVPSALQASLDMPGFVPPPLKVVVLMGEYVPRTLAQQAVERFPPTTSVYSIYGSTEASSALVCNLRELLQPGAELPLGKPIARDVVAFVLGPDLRPVAPGSTGRLHIGGPLLFSGYFRDPDLTARALVALPGSGESVYDTHDDVRVAVDGSIEFVGRVDDTVKVRGFRVDLREVERCLQGHPSVRQAAAVLETANPSNPTLCAFVVPSDVDTDGLFVHLRDRLPHYMIPSTITALQSFPLTVRGKLDRQRLLEERDRHRGISAVEAPAPGLEQQVAAVWSSVLGHRQFGRTTSFFEAGGTSLTAFTLVHRLRGAYSLGRSVLTEQAIYRQPSVAGQAALLEALRSGDRQAAESRVPVLVTLRGGQDAALEPLFMVASAGGTLGAYERLARCLRTRREIIGIRDPYLWGQRDPGTGFRAWIDTYFEALRARQPTGPYFLAAYSSAGAFGYELAQRLRSAGERVHSLILIDPLGLDISERRSFGWWAMRATYARPWTRLAVRCIGHLRRWLPAADDGRRADPLSTQSQATPGQPGQRSSGPELDAGHIASLSALMELNTGLPLTLDQSEVRSLADEDRLKPLQSRFSEYLPDVDAGMVERIARQYRIQVVAHNAYRPDRCDAPVLLCEPSTAYAGLLKALLRPCVAELRHRTIRLGAPSARVEEICRRFGPLASHYRCMRDDRFVAELAAEIDAVL